MTLYSIGEVAERCAINPVTLRAWQRRYGLFKPQRSEGGHRQFDDEDILRIEEIKRLIKSGVSVGKVKALLEASQTTTLDHEAWRSQQDEVMTVLRLVQPAKLRTKIADLGQVFAVDTLIDHVFIPVRQCLGLDKNTARAMISLLDGLLIEYVIQRLADSRNKEGKDTLLIGWESEDRIRLWLEAWRLSQHGWRPDVLADPLESPRPELFPGQHIFVWTGKVLTMRQQEQLEHWQKQGFAIKFHSGQ
ncbi:putative HTH-type transcriptional regulator [Buttiauxella gaviniae ATCC 51604]|uniref:Putative HTH-type transcriptional regulator n=2 Tax=Buttiauxella gaviniae TaxID=82990 RepID=A0A1B7HMH0_9ENTR|nr:MerR family transcriptional regulator [Buttiauxella gaviniae]OAT16817.1 putative HTH-type transcriptional regulator [Buttiauxella gaviniae ATCC 51604]